MMYWILLVMGAVVSLVAAVLVGGFLVPSAYRASRTATFALDGDAIDTTWRTLDTIGDWPLWTEQARTVTVAESARPALLRARVHGDDGGVRAQLTLDVRAVAGGVEVCATDEGALTNPVARLFRHYVSGHAALVTAVLSALGEQLGDQLKAPVQLRDG